MTSIKDMSYLELCRRSVMFGRPIPPPESVDQLEELVEHFPERAMGYLPSRLGCVRLGLSGNFGRPVMPLPLELRERIVVTLAEDRDFCAVLRELIGGGHE